LNGVEIVYNTNKSNTTSIMSASKSKIQSIHLFKWPYLKNQMISFFFGA